MSLAIYLYKSNQRFFCNSYKQCLSRYQDKLYQPEIPQGFLYVMFKPSSTVSFLGKLIDETTNLFLFIRLSVCLSSI